MMSFEIKINISLKQILQDYMKSDTAQQVKTIQLLKLEQKGVGAKKTK